MAIEIILLLSVADTISDKRLTAFRILLWQYFKKELPLYLEYLVLTHDDIDFDRDKGDLWVKGDVREKYQHCFEKAKISLKAASVGFFPIKTTKSQT